MKALFVHLSDIHFGQEKDGGTCAVNNDARERLIEDARERVTELGGKVSGIIVTGDVAYSGKAAEYQEAGRWLDRLSEAVGCSRVDVQVVPGNHDIDRDRISRSAGLALDEVAEKGSAVLDQLLDNDEDRRILYDRFAAYIDFALDYRSELDMSGGFSKGDSVELANGRTLRFVRLNSALICSRRDSKGKLVLGRRQQVLPRAAGEEVVVLVHHPLSWFQDSASARRYIRKRARVVISGHEHFPGLEVEQVDAGRDVLLLAAGATNPDEIDGDYTYKYNILGFEWDEASDGLCVTVDPRTWDDEELCFVSDKPFLDRAGGRRVLASPNFRRAARPAASGEIVGAGGQPISVPIVEEVVAPEETRVRPTIDERLLQLRFFRELTEGQRIAALVSLGALPTMVRGTLDHAMQRRLFRLLLDKGKAGEIEGLVARAEAAEGENR